MKKLFLILLLNLISTLVVDANETKPLAWQKSQLPIKTELRASAVGQNTLWVAGDKSAVFISFDNGKNWQDISPKYDNNIDYNFRDIEVINNTTAIVMSVGSAEESTLQITHNQGKTWQILRTNKNSLGFYDSIDFWDENSGILLGDPVDGHFVVEVTKDQGQSWQRVPINKLPAITNKEAAFAASGNTLITGAMGEAWFTTGGLSASIYYSPDFGQSWSKTNIPLESSTETSGGYALGINTQQQVFALGGNYLNREGHYNNLTTFKNSRWQAVNNGKHGLRTALSCAKHICVSTGKLSSDISMDNGKTWQVFANEGFYTLASDNAHILAAGSEGKVAVLTISNND